MPNTMDLALLEIVNLEFVRGLWQELELRAKPCFFTSWLWIGTWLGLLPADVKPRLLQARHAGRTMGLAIVVDGAPRRRFGREIYQTAYLHATGRSEIDVICIEHNDFLLDETLADETRAAMCGYWLDHLPPATEISLPWLGGRGWPQTIEKRSKRGISREDSINRSYLVDLQAVREAGGNYLKLIGAKTRSNISRSMREYGKLGELRVDAARTLEEGFAWLEQLRGLHTARWESRGQTGSFASDYFYRFHSTLVERHLLAGHVQLLRIRAGDSTIGYLYKFIKAGRVYDYMSGFDYKLIEKHGRPGLVSHALAIQHYASTGHDVYDFMAGDNEYKMELRTFEESMTNTVMRTRSWRFGLYGKLRKVEPAIRKVRSLRRRIGGKKRQR